MILFPQIYSFYVHLLSNKKEDIKTLYLPFSPNYAIIFFNEKTADRNRIRVIDEKQVEDVQDYDSNQFKFINTEDIKILDNNNSGKVVDYDRNIVFTLNKDEFLKSFINKSFPTITNCFCFGDNYADYDCVLNILEGQKDKLIGYGFLNFLPSKFGKEENKTEEEESLNGYKKVFDVVQLNDSGFEIVVENLKFIKGEKIMEWICVLNLKFIVK